MRRLKYTLLIAITVLCSSLFSINVYAEETKPDTDRSEAAPEEWEFVLELYGWMAGVDATTAGGHDVEIEFDDILDNFDFAIMGVLGARKNKWSFMTDIIFMDLGNDSNTSLNQTLQVTRAIHLPGTSSL